LTYYFFIGAVHKRRPHSWGRRVCPVRTFCGQGLGGDSSNADVRTFWRKNLRILQIRKGGGRSIFRDFVRTSFMDGPIYKFILNGGMGVKRTAWKWIRSPPCVGRSPDLKHRKKKI